MVAEIKYNNVVIATLEAGQTATLVCSGKPAKSDIVAVFGSAGSISYNGVKTSVGAGKTATLTCAGKMMETNVVVTTSDNTTSVLGKAILGKMILGRKR